MNSNVNGSRVSKRYLWAMVGGLILSMTVGADGEQPLERSPFAIFEAPHFTGRVFPEAKQARYHD